MIDKLYPFGSVAKDPEKQEDKKDIDNNMSTYTQNNINLIMNSQDGTIDK